MKILTTSQGVYGPFRVITTLASGYNCDGIIYPFSVIGAAGVSDYAPDVILPVFDRESWKVERANKVAAILVIVDDMVFDGDETSQNRMSRAVAALQFAQVETTFWTLSNNSTVEVTVEQLQRALVASGLAQTAIWAEPEEA